MIGALRAAPALCVAVAALAALPGDAGAREIWLEWRTPAEGQRFAGPVGWTGVEGWAGVGDPVDHDVVLVIDVSGSTAIASGVDIDGDGSVGRYNKRRENWRSFNARQLSSDPGDTVLAAELLASRRLVEVLDPDRTRIGIVSFSDGASLLAPLGSERAKIEAALKQLDQAFGSGATDMGRAIDRGVEALLAGRTPGAPPRRRTLLVLSDGWPTAPVSEKVAAQAALDAAARAAESVHQRHHGCGGARSAAPARWLLRRIPAAGPGREQDPRHRARRRRRLAQRRAHGLLRRALAAQPGGGGCFDAKLLELKATLEQRRLEAALAAEIEAARNQRRELEVRPEAPAP